MSTAYDPVARPTYAGLMPDERRDRPAAGAATEADEVPVFGTPIYARTAKKRSGLPIPAIAAGVAAAAILAAAGYYMMQPRQELFAEQTTTAPAAAPPVTEIAAAAPVQEPIPALAEQRTQISENPVVREARTPIRTARARPAPVADSPETWASDTSARLPDAPIPYSALAQTPAGAPAAAAPVAPPVIAPPAPETAAPAAPAPVPESLEEPTP